MYYYPVGAEKVNVDVSFQKHTCLSFIVHHLKERLFRTQQVKVCMKMGMCARARYTHQLSLQGPHLLSVTALQDTQDSTRYLDTSRSLLYPRVMLWLGCRMCVRQSINLINCELNICATLKKSLRASLH